MACGGVQWLEACQFIPSLVAAAGLVVLALWVFILEFRNRVHQAFSLLMFLYAGVVAMPAFDLTADAFAGRIRSYFIIAVPFAALFFAYVYRLRYARGGIARSLSGRRWIPWTILGAAVLAEALYLYDHDYFAKCDASTCTAGVLYLLFPLMYVAFAGISILFAIDFVAARPGPCRRALYLATVAFALLPLHASSFISTFNVGDGFMVATGQWLNIAESMLWALPAVLLAGLAVWLLAATRSAAEARRDVRRLLAILPLPLVAGVAMASAMILWPQAGLQILFANFVPAALFTLTLAGLVAYALGRHQLFEIDVKIRLAISRTTLASLFVAVFFVVSEGTAALVGERLGGDSVAAVIGILAAGLLLFALHPLQHWASRVAEKAMPHVKSVRDMTNEERLALYRDQAELAWLDGSLTAKERLLLDQLRDRIGLTPEEAYRLERAAMQPIGPRTRTQAQPR